MRSGGNLQLYSAVGKNMTSKIQCRVCNTAVDCRTYCFGGHYRVQTVKGPVNARVFRFEIGIYGILENAEGVVWPLMQVHAHLLEDSVWHIVEGVASQDSCMPEIVTAGKGDSKLRGF